MIYAIVSALSLSAPKMTLNPIGDLESHPSRAFVNTSLYTAMPAYPATPASEVLDDLLSKEVRLLDKPASEYSAKCMTAWKPYNDARCWCYTGCALDCTHEPNAADGVPGTPGLDIHPSWCTPSKRASIEDCKDLTCAVEADCADEPEADRPGLGKLALTAEYTCKPKEEKKFDEPSAWAEKGIVCTAEDAAAKALGALDWTVTDETIGHWDYPEPTAARFVFEEDCNNGVDHPTQHGKVHSTFTLDSAQDMVVVLSGMGEHWYEKMTVTVDGKQVVQFSANMNGDNLVKMCGPWQIVTVQHPDVPVALAAGTHKIELYVTSTDGIANFGYFQMKFAFSPTNTFTPDPACAPAYKKAHASKMMHLLAQQKAEAEAQK